MRWHVVQRADSSARALADRHYNRQRVGAHNFAPPGRALVLLIPGAALWVTSWQYPEFVRHDWPGAWVCSAFRNERPDAFRSSELILEAVAATRWKWPDVPTLGMITFVDRSKTRPKRDPGRCYRKAGFVPATPGETAGGLVALQLAPRHMPPPQPPLSSTGYLFAGGRPGRACVCCGRLTTRPDVAGLCMACAHDEGERRELLL